MRIDFPTQASLRGRQGSKWNRFPIDVLPATPAEGDFAPCPAVDRALRSWLERQSFGYPQRGRGGPAEALRRAFNRRMRSAFDWSPDPQATLLTTSGTQALAACVIAYSEPGEGVGFHAPAFPAFWSAVHATHRRPIPQPLVEWQGRLVLSAKVHRSPKSRMFLLCHPHNPTGRAFDANELEALARWVEREDMVVVSDELHAELMLNGRRHQPFAKLFPSLAERTVTLCSPSKAFGLGGLGCTVLHFGSRTLEERFRERVPPDLLGEPAVPSLIACEAAWRGGDRWLKSLVNLIERNRDRVIEQLALRAPELRVFRSEATFFLWADMRRLGVSGRPYELLLRNGKVAASDGALYGEHFDGFIRLVIATSPERIDELIERLLCASGSLRSR